ncbi:G-protein coupled receptor 161-like [Ruditapes philippinarum]|uniref:G-protein coupled receptor 161-like n=1 Tax=Ruditapes philippinarum TaxID=129788 RepID=UPI00295B6E49|nr:G-protein coupled receptor 161-like [Ruditapes philippinarum]
MQREILRKILKVFQEMNLTGNFENESTTEEKLESFDLADEKLQTTNVVVMAITLIVIFCVSFAGNVFVFLIFYKKPALVTISNRFIVNLSVCNVMETMFVMPFVFAALVTQNWQFGMFWCQTTGFLMNAIFAASTLTLVIIAIDRYCAVIKPLHYSMHMTSRRCTLMIASVWILAVCCSIPPLFGWNRYEFQRTKLACTAVSTSKDSNDMTFTIFIVTLCFILPLFIIVWAYCVIFNAAKTNSEKVRKNSMPPNALEDQLSQTPLRNNRRMSAVPILVHRLSVSSRSSSVLWRRDEWKAAVTSCMVVFTFIICWLLYFIIIILECLIDEPGKINPVIKTISILLAMSSCALNPLVYVFRSKIQRVELKGILGIQTKRENTCNGNISQSRRPSLCTTIRDSPSISRQGSEDSDIIITKLHHVTTATTLTSMIVAEEPEYHDNART